MSGRRGIPFVVAAPSGTGKTTVCRRLVEQDPLVVFSVSHTTRARRPDERDGVDYHFVSPRQFDELVRQGAFLEWAEYNRNRYGTSFAAIEGPLALGHDVLLEIEIQGAAQVRARRSDARLIFLLPPSLKVLEERLRARGTDPPEEVERRLAEAQREIAAAPRFDYAVVNAEVERAVACVREILDGERTGATGPLRRRYDPRQVLARVLEAG
jgi:guanylate kinase